MCAYINVLNIHSVFNLITLLLCKVSFHNKLLNNKIYMMIIYDILHILEQKSDNFAKLSIELF